ncbi:MAG: hypothetical protein IKT42_03560 [Clostridia bacterium]|nr:hypothetical protein [Clostridia bacterium]
MEEKTINIMDLVMLAWRKLWIIAIAAVLCAALAFGYCKFCVTPSYSATASILVTNGAVTTSYAETTDKISGSDISASLYLSYTVVDILNTPDIYMELAEELGEKNYQSLRGGFSVSRRSEDTLFIDITYSSTDMNKATSVVNKFAQVACDYIPGFIPSAKANVVSTAVNASQTYPRTTMTTAVVGLLGAAIAFIVLFAMESMNHAIKGEEDFTQSFDVPLLGAVPDFENVDNGGYRKNKGRGGYGSGY